MTSEEIQKHNGTKISLKGELCDFASFWSEWPVATRMAVIKSLIFTAPDMHRFRDLVVKELSSDKFSEQLD
jgi:hypothetical protein